MLASEIGVRGVHVPSARKPLRATPRDCRPWRRPKGGRIFHRPVLGEHQKLRAVAGSLCNPARELVAVGAERAEGLQRILRGGNSELRHHSAFIQNCIGFSVSAGWSTSFQLKRPTMPSATS